MYSENTIDRLNNDIQNHFSNIVSPIMSGDKSIKSGVGKLVMLDRYSYKDTEKKTLQEDDFVILTVVNDPKFPARGIGQYKGDHKGQALIEVTPEFEHLISEDEPRFGTRLIRNYSDFDKPMELFYEQIARRVARGLTETEDPMERSLVEDNFANELAQENIVPAGRILYGAGSETDVTYFNCYVLPMPKDSREGIQKHRTKAMEIMSRGGGVGTNGSTLRPRGALAKGVNGRSSGSVSWLNDLANLTNLVEQGGSRRGAQMIMLNDWHPDIYEFVISKMQNPDILRLLIRDSKDPIIVALAKDKLKFTPYSPQEKEDLEDLANYYDLNEDADNTARIMNKITEGGHYSVNDPEFMAGANISVNITHEFMEAVKYDEMYDLRFPDVDSYNKQEKAVYNALWHHDGDVRSWEKKGERVKVYRSIRARDLWDLINTCATYSAEPGIFFIDNANDMTNAKSYGQKVVATNPCGEQPLAPYSVCNLLAINLANMTSEGRMDWIKLTKSVSTAVRMGDNVIDSTPYFLAENEKMAKDERRIGLGVMGLADLLIDLGIPYGSQMSIDMIDHIFETIATIAYRTSIGLARKKGSFPLLNKELFVQTGFMQKMPAHIRDDVMEYGIRNSHLLTVAPTGSTGTMIGVSTGLEPYFAFKYYRSGRLGKNIEVNAPILEKFLKSNPDVDPDNLPEQFVSTMQISPQAHVAVQVAIQRWIDSSISKTVNAPAGFTVDQVQEIYETLYEGGAKGGTVYVDGSRNAQVLSLTKDDAKETKKVYIDETVRPLRETSVNYGNEIGDQCPVCRQGKIIDRGGCTECDSCQAQLKCGL